MSNPNREVNEYQDNFDRDESGTAASAIDGEASIRDPEIAVDNNIASRGASNMAKEAKIAITAIAVLLGVFGYLLFRRLSRTEEPPVPFAAKSADQDHDDSPDGDSETATGGQIVGQAGLLNRDEPYNPSWKSSSDDGSQPGEDQYSESGFANATQDTPSPDQMEPPDYSAYDARQNSASVDDYYATHEPAPFDASSGTSSAQAYADSPRAMSPESESAYGDSYPTNEQPLRAGDGTDDLGVLTSQETAGSDAYIPKPSDDQFQRIRDSMNELLPADETTYEVGGAVQTAGTQPARESGYSSSGYNQTRQSSPRDATAQAYTPEQYRGAQYDPQNQVPAFRDSSRRSSSAVGAQPVQPYPSAQSTGTGQRPAYSNRPDRGLSRSDAEYTVESLDNFWVISKKLYGTGAYFKALYEHNRGKFPRADQLHPGDVIQTPSVAMLEASHPDLCPPGINTRSDGRSGQYVTKQSIGRGMNSRAGGTTYVVEKGDSLFDIAKYELGNAARWSEIYELNRNVLGNDMDHLKPGAELVLPSASAAGTITRRRGNPLRR